MHHAVLPINIHPAMTQSVFEFLTEGTYKAVYSRGRLRASSRYERPWRREGRATLQMTDGRLVEAAERTERLPLVTAQLR